ncbi:MAG: phosphopentomutase [Firmicutes bacterium]|nr:phosphopentomutase [Bacillota bacterium]
MKRLFLIVLDSCGIGEAPDAAKFGDEGSNTLRACADTGLLNIPNMERLGMFNIDGMDWRAGCAAPSGAYGRLQERADGKDTTTGHWEIAGLTLTEPFPTFPNGFPDDIIAEFKKISGRGVLCNKPYSGTEVIKDYGAEHMKTGDLIVYTSADSVFQIAAHEDVVPLEELYEICEKTRRLLDPLKVGRVIARPFIGETGSFTRTKNRHDFSYKPPKNTLLDDMKAAGLDVISVGKIADIFAGKGITEAVRTASNADGMRRTDEYLSADFNGLCFVNLVDFDMLYGHRNDADGYARALSEFDEWLGGFTARLGEDDAVMITADHGCDPSTPSTDHSREYIFLLACGKGIKPANIGTRGTFADIGKTIADIFGIENELDGTSFKDMILR